MRKGKQILGAMTLALVVTGAELAAQAPMKPATDEKTLVGCLRQSRADTTTANTQGEIYTLEGPAEKLPTSPAPEGSGPVELTKFRYLLSFDKSVDLSKHVNHQVQVTGHQLPRGGDAAKSVKGTETAKPLPGAAAQMFHVASLEMIAAECK